MAPIDLLNRAPIRRDYAAILAALPEQAQPLLHGDVREAAMNRVVQVLWTAFGSEQPGVFGVSWIGFYAKAAGADEMVLVCREPKPACSPIGLHGMCGRAWREVRALVIADVRTLGGNYIACDPKDQSELVVPVMNDDGSCWGVLDADSFDRGAFDEHDAEGMRRLMEHLGVSAGAAPARAVRL